MNRTISVMLVMLATVLIGCTPGMHRAYQYTMAGTASAGFVCAGLQTRAALQDDTVRENNPTLGDHPGDTTLIAVGLLNQSVVGAVMSLPRGDDRYKNPFGGTLTPLPDIAVDVIVTALAVFAVGDAYADNTLAPRTWCGIR